jgi:hypothetical protein
MELLLTINDGTVAACGGVVFLDLITDGEVGSAVGSAVGNSNERKEVKGVDVKVVVLGRGKELIATVELNDELKAGAEIFVAVVVAVLMGAGDIWETSWAAQRLGCRIGR